MLFPKNLFMLSPHEEIVSGSITENSNDEVKKDDNISEDISSETKQKPSLLKKVKDALQDWSNSDQAEQQFDDTRP